MGCVKSKQRSSTGKKENSLEGADGRAMNWRGENACLVQSETCSVDGSPRVDPVLLDYAQRLSEEIVSRAVQQWVEVDSRYSDIPYIECDVP